MHVLTTLIASRRNLILSLAALGLTACACSVYAAAGGTPGAPAALNIINPFSLQPMTVAPTTDPTLTRNTSSPIGVITDPGNSADAGNVIFTRPPTRNPFRPPVRSPFVPGPPL
jgi:hypothetical protein